jgi:hypothetical protein
VRAGPPTLFEAKDVRLLKSFTLYVKVVLKLYNATSVPMPAELM